MALTNTLAIRLELLAKEFESQIKRVNKLLDETGKSGKKAEVGVDGLVRQATAFIERGPSVGQVFELLIQKAKSMNAATAIAAVTVGFLANELRKASDQSKAAAEELIRLSQRTALSASFLSELRLAAETSNTSLSDVAAGMRVLNRNLGAAARGSEQAKDRFKQFGVEAFDAQGRIKPLERILLDIADRTKQFGDSATAAQQLTVLFGFSASRIAPLLLRGSEAIAAMRKEAIQLGDAMSQELIDRFDRLSAAEARLAARNRGLKLAVGEAVLPLREIGVALQIATLEAGGNLPKFIGAFARELGRMREEAEKSAAGVDDLAESFDKAAKAVTPLAALIETFQKRLAEVAGRPEGAEGILAIGKQLASLGSEGAAALDALIAEVERMGQTLGPVRVNVSGLLRDLRELRALPIPFRVREEALRTRGRGGRGAITGIAPPTRPLAFGAIGPETEQFTPIPAQPLAMQDQVKSLEEINKDLEDQRDLWLEIRGITLSQAQAVQSFAGTIGDLFVSAAEQGKAAFAAFAKDTLRWLARMIARAIIFKVLTSAFPGLGKLIQSVSSFLNPLGTAGFQHTESSVMGRLQESRSLAVGGGFEPALAGAAAGGEGGRPLEVRIFNATPATYVEIADRHIIPRIDQRLRYMNERSFTRGRT